MICSAPSTSTITGRCIDRGFCSIRISRRAVQPWAGSIGTSGSSNSRSSKDGSRSILTPETIQGTGCLRILIALFPGTRSRVSVSCCNRSSSSPLI